MRWRRISRYPDLEISDAGNVRISGKLRSLVSSRKDSYLQVNYRHSVLYIHRLVAEAFIGPPSLTIADPTVNHKDGNRRHNHPKNLEWVSRQENGYHQRDVLKQAALTVDKVKAIRLYLAEHGKHYGYRVQLAAKFNCSRKTIDLAVNQKRWRDV